MSDDEDEEERKREEDRRAWLGDPIEHGGGYRPARDNDLSFLAVEGGCCALEAVASVGLVLGLVLSLYPMLP